MELIERLNAAWTAAHSRALTPIAPRLLTEAVEEIERLRGALQELIAAEDGPPDQIRDAFENARRVIKPNS